MDTEPYPVVAGLLIRKAVTWQIPYPKYGARAIIRLWKRNIIWHI